MKSNVELIKKVDKQGRLVLPGSWRKKKARHGRVVLRVEEDRIIIEPYRPVDLTEFFDRVEVDIRSDLADWKAVRRELFEIR